MSKYWYCIVLISIIIFLLRKDLRNKMLWSGLLSIPVLFLKPLLSANFFDLVSQLNPFYFYAERAIIGFGIGAFAASLYEVFLHKKITPEKHPHRPKLILLSIGLVIMLVGLLLDLPLAYCLAAALLIDLALVLSLRFDLIYDALFSGVGMGCLYLLIYLINFATFPGDRSNFWFSDQIFGVTLFSIPVEEVIIIILFGALWGSLYVATKDLHEK